MREKWMEGGLEMIVILKMKENKVNGKGLFMFRILEASAHFLFSCFIFSH